MEIGVKKTVEEAISVMAFSNRFGEKCFSLIQQLFTGDCDVNSMGSMPMFDP